MTDNPTPPGWPDPLESPQAEAIRNGKIDDVEIRNLFDQMEREIRVHRKTFCERAASTSGLAGEAVAKPGIPTEEEVLGLPDVGGDDEMALAAVPPSIPAGGVREALAYARAWINDNLREGDIPGCTALAAVTNALATLSLPAGGVAVSDAMRERLKIARGHLSNIEAHGNAEANAVLVIRNVLLELEASITKTAAPLGVDDEALASSLPVAAPGNVSTIEWHRLIDGDPPETGRYIVAHRGMSMLAIYRPPSAMPKGSKTVGWDRDVSFATHWAKEPHAPDDGTPQLFKPEGQRLRAEADEIKSWEALQT